MELFFEKKSDFLLDFVESDMVELIDFDFSLFTDVSLLVFPGMTVRAQRKLVNQGGQRRSAMMSAINKYSCPFREAQQYPVNAS